MEIFQNTEDKTVMGMAKTIIKLCNLKINTTDGIQDEEEALRAATRRRNIEQYRRHIQDIVMTPDSTKFIKDTEGFSKQNRSKDISKPT